MRLPVAKTFSGSMVFLRPFRMSMPVFPILRGMNFFLNLPTPW